MSVAKFETSNQIDIRLLLASISFQFRFIHSSILFINVFHCSINFMQYQSEQFDYNWFTITFSDHTFSKFRHIHFFRNLKNFPQKFRASLRSAVLCSPSTRQIKTTTTTKINNTQITQLSLSSTAFF